MKHTLRTVAVTLAALPAGVGAPGCGAGTGNGAGATQAGVEEAEFRLRSDVEAALPGRAEAFAADPGDDDARRAYADILLKLGNVWEADEVIAPLADPASASVPDLRLAARTAYLLGDYGRAETLYGRLMQLTGEGSEDREEAAEGADPRLVPDEPVREGAGASAARRHGGRLRASRLPAGVRGRALRDRVGAGRARRLSGDDERHHRAWRPSHPRPRSGRPDRVARPRHGG